MNTHKVAIDIIKHDRTFNDIYGKEITREQAFGLPQNPNQQEIPEDNERAGRENKGDEAKEEAK